ncbi:hypothetical protein WJX82_009630 [Trebouxia sp. C0006]
MHRQKRATAELCQPERSAQGLAAKLAAVKHGQSEEVYIYSDALQKDSDSITVDLQDIKQYIAELYELFRRDPGIAMPLLETAVLKFLNPRAQKDEEMQNQREPTDISRLVMISGAVTRAEERQDRAAKLVFKCKGCGTVKTVIGRPGLGKVTCPKACDSITVEGSSNLCGRDPFFIEDRKCKFVDHQVLKLQDLPEIGSPGEPPDSLQMMVEGSLVYSIPPGTEVKVTAVYNVMKNKQGRHIGYLRVVGVQHIGKQDLRHAPFTAEEEASSQVMPDGTARRGDIHVLLIGDPSTAKSQFLKFAAQMQR